MTASRNNIHERLVAFDFKGLFTQELNWNHFQTRDLEVSVDGCAYTLVPVAQRIMAVYECVPDTDVNFPKYTIRRKIDAQVSKLSREHIIIFHDQAKTVQIWQWVKKEAGKPSACREQAFYTGQSGEALIQKIQSIAFSLEDEANIGASVERVSVAFDLEKVTKRFYELFKKEHDIFHKCVQGIPDKELERWYVSVMLNRLMFIYFIQKKGFLGGDQQYLTTKLAESKRRGTDKFYREFLCPLFFEGFAKRPEQRDAQVNRLLGQVPYLNGGLFLRHQIEQVYGKYIQITDKAFESIFNFFEQYDWHLDDRPTRTGREINPDVLGYVFEKYINQKEMGAYYTKEDITEYISKSTIIPVLFGMAQKSCAIAFDGDHSVWRLLEHDPDRYIHAAMLWGMDKPLPPSITAGLNDVSKRPDWNKPADSEYQLTTETWRDVVARRTRCEEVRKKLAAGEVRSINDFITYNLDIRRFVEEVIVNCEGPELLRAFYKSIQSISVLDPACGSGAFLFAALNILERLYDTCLVRMQAFVDDLNRSHEKHSLEKYKDFRKLLEEMNDKQRHPSPRYFILKQIILNNLYGVDIMEEATEICKLRLFLKLVAQVDAHDNIEPLPDIDFNIRAGNTLVGFANRDAVKHAIESKLAFDNTLQQIEERAEDAERAFERFRQMQVEHGMSTTDFSSAKATLSTKLTALRDELDGYLAGEYGIKPKDAAGLERWKRSHQPFHWFTEFYGIMKSGGFDVIVGNPPWREYAAVKKDYIAKGYLTEKAGNIYALFIERCFALRGDRGNFSFIVQLPVVCSSRMAVTRDILRQNSQTLYVATFGDRPGRLFEGIENCRATILNSVQRGPDRKVFSTRYHRWPSSARSQLFSCMEYAPVATVSSIFPDRIPKLPSMVAVEVFRKVGQDAMQALGLSLSPSTSSHFIFYQEATQYWVKATLGLPYYRCNGRTGAPPHGRYLYLRDLQSANVICAILNSSLFYLYFISYGDCFHLSDTLVSTFPIPPAAVQDSKLAELGEHLLRDITENAVTKQIITHAGDKISYAEFFGWKSKPLIDSIDDRLASLYRLNREEVDFVQNFDSKFRLSQIDETGEQQSTATTN